MARFIFITGGVVSSLGKGLMAASLAALLQARGYRVRIRKFDPYLNVDPGTMSPYQHGEVYVTDDGAETDLDLGHYERFTGVSARQKLPRRRNPTRRNVPSGWGGAGKYPDKSMAAPGRGGGGNWRRSCSLRVGQNALDGQNGGRIP